MLRGRSALPVVAPLLVGGCYTYTVSATERPVPATVVEVTLNDRGRVAMETNVGPEVLTIEGAVAAVADSAFVLLVRRVVDLNRRSSTWTGESVAVRMDHVRQLRERRFAASRTILLAGSITVGAAFVIAGPLNGLVQGTPGGPGGGGGGGGTVD